MADHRSCAALRCGSFAGLYGSPSACAAECESRSGDGRCPASAAALLPALLPTSSSAAAGLGRALLPVSHSSGDLTVRKTRMSALRESRPRQLSTAMHGAVLHAPGSHAPQTPREAPERPGHYRTARRRVRRVRKQQGVLLAHLLRRLRACRPCWRASTRTARCQLCSARLCTQSARASLPTGAPALAAVATRRRCASATGLSALHTRARSAHEHEASARCNSRVEAPRQPAQAAPRVTHASAPR